MQDVSSIHTRAWLFPVLFLVFATILEMVNFMTLGIGVLPTYFMFDVAVFLIFLGVLFLIPTGSKGWIWLASFFLLIQVAMNIVNDTIYNVFGDVFSLSMLNLGPEGFNAFRFEFLDIGIILLNIGIFVTFILLCCYLRGNLGSTAIAQLGTKSRFAIVISLCLAFQIIGSSCFASSVHVITVSSKGEHVEQSEITTDEALWDNMFLKTESFKRFGTYGFYLKNISNFIFTSGAMSESDRERVAAYIQSGETNKPPVTSVSNIGKGDNLIVLMLESFDNFAIDPVYTPYLWNIRTGNGLATYYDGYYARNKTNISEEIAIMGHIANDKLLNVYNDSVGLCTPTSLPNLFKADAGENSSVNFFHSYTKKFYDREHVNVKLGFENVYAMEDCTLENKSKTFNDWVLDSEYLENMLDKFMPDDKRFYSFYTTITTHGAYDYDNKRLRDNKTYVNEHFDEYVNYVESQTNLLIPTNKTDLNKLKHFKAACMDTDRMVQYLFEMLEEKGLLETTTVVMFADHNAYYSNLCYKVKNIPKDEYENTELYHIPLMIYNDQIGGGVNNTFCNTYDIYPTICDILGIEYNTALVQGYSIYSDDIKKSVFVSSLSGMYTDTLFTNNIDDVFVLDETLTAQDVEDFQDNITDFYKKQEYIELIYRYNYFEKVAQT